jgi:hypothetical protein
MRPRRLTQVMVRCRVDAARRSRVALAASLGSSEAIREFVMDGLFTPSPLMRWLEAAA